MRLHIRSITYRCYTCSNEILLKLDQEYNPNSMVYHDTYKILIDQGWAVTDRIISCPQCKSLADDVADEAKSDEDYKSNEVDLNRQLGGWQMI